MQRPHAREWALLGSRSLFAEFPGLGRRWVAVLGPFKST